MGRDISLLLKLLVLNFKSSLPRFMRSSSVLQKKSRENLKYTEREQMILFIYPEITTLSVKSMESNDLSIESSLYASGGHHGELTWHV